MIDNNSRSQKYTIDLNKFNEYINDNSNIVNNLPYNSRATNTCHKETIII